MALRMMLLPPPPELRALEGVRWVTWLRWVLLASAGLLVLATGALLGLRLAHAGVALPGVEVDGVGVGGLDRSGISQRLEDVDRSGTPITIVVDDREATLPAGDLGYRLDRQATVEATLRRGRQGNPLRSLADHLRSFVGPIAVPAVAHVDRGKLADGIDAAAAELALAPVEADLQIDGTDVRRVEPVPGERLDTQALATALPPALLGHGATRLEAATEAEAPSTESSDLDAVAAQAERAVSSPVTLTRGEVVWELTPSEIGQTLRVDREGGELELTVDPAALEGVAGEVVAAVGRDPVDATVRLVGGRPQVVPSDDGFAFEPVAAASQVLELATGDGPRTGELAGDLLEPARTTAEAEALSVTEQVSTYTTEFPCCQGRVQNIHRMAALLDGVLLEPGEELSLNQHVGPRTRDNGFTDGGAILQGEFVEQVGGGVSQFATTMYNAAYFGGYAVPVAQPHSYYISRYPPGREATLNYPEIDLRIRNSSPHGLLVSTSATPTSVTVSLWGRRWVEVASETGPRREVQPPPVQHRRDESLPRGERVVVQEGREGFTITDTRVLRFPDGSVERHSRTTRYRPEPRIVASGPPSDPNASDGAGDDDGDQDDR